MDAKLVSCIPGLRSGNVALQSDINYHSKPNLAYYELLPVVLCARGEKFYTYSSHSHMSRPRGDYVFDSFCTIRGHHVWRGVFPAAGKLDHISIPRVFHSGLETLLMNLLTISCNLGNTVPLEIDFLVTEELPYLLK
jgi:hypothetical protein